MERLLLGFGILALFLYTVWLAVAGVVRWIRGLLKPETRGKLAPLWRRKAGIPLLFWVPALALMVPNLLEAITRSRTFRAMADLRKIATACEAYFVDQNHYPAAGSIDELALLLGPKYLNDVPRKDLWGEPYTYYTRDVRGGGPQSYILVCTGSDRKAETKDPWSYQEGATTDYTNDIVYSDGRFVRYPEGRSN